MSETDCPGCRARDVIIAELRACIAELQRRPGEQDQRLQQQEQRIRELEARLKINSSNSSMPPSANPPSAPQPPSRPPTGRKPGGQPGHPGHCRPVLPAERVTDWVHYVPTVCQNCHASLPPQSCLDAPEPIRHQVIDLPAVLASVTEHPGHAGICPHGGQVTWGAIPPEVLAHGFGPRLTAAIAFLSGRCHDSKRTIEEVVETLLEVPISLGSISKAEQEMASALQPPYAQAQQAVREAAVKNVDETGWSLGGKLCWLWLAAGNGVAFFQICLGRGRASLEQLLGSPIRGVLCSDRWSAYSRMAVLWRQVCWAHLKRDFQKWLDYGRPTAWIGQAGLEAVRRLFEAWDQFREGVLDRPGLQAALDPVILDLYGVLEAGASCPVRQTARFCRNLLEVYPALWTFARVEGVEPTNNLAERLLRAAVIWRKISFGNHSEEGCRFVERVLTVVETLRLQRRPVLAYLTEVLTTHRAGRPAPMLVPAGA